jgi:hypothetical protein
LSSDDGTASIASRSGADLPALDGGVWFSSDGGANRSPLDDYIVSPSLFGGAAEADSLSVGALAVMFGASAISDEMYVGTGEANGNYGLEPELHEREFGRVIVDRRRQRTDQDVLRRVLPRGGSWHGLAMYFSEV